MKYYIDTEFSGPDLISLALVAEDGRELYMAASDDTLAAMRPEMDPWVWKNVVRVVECAGARSRPFSFGLDLLGEFFAGDSRPVFIADWPTDFQHFLPLLHDDCGNMVVNIPSFECHVERVDAYPTDLPGAVQHNALWDARALKHHLDAA